MRYFLMCTYKDKRCLIWKAPRWNALKACKLRRQQQRMNSYENFLIESTCLLFWRWFRKRV